MAPSTLRLAFKLKNTDANNMSQLASGPWCLFGQVRLLERGSEVEHIGPYYGRQHELFRHLLLPNAWSIEITNEDRLAFAAGKVIGPGQYLSMSTTPLLGLLQATKYLPIRYMGGMQLEFTLSNVSEAGHPNSASTSCCCFAVPVPVFARFVPLPARHRAQPVECHQWMCPPWQKSKQGMHQITVLSSNGQIWPAPKKNCQHFGAQKCF